MDASSPLVLRSKLRPPTIGAEVVDRPRLVSTLVASGVPLTVVAAPAGYGKTTLVARAMDEIESPTAWMTVDSADSDRARFYAHLAAALESAGVASQAIRAALESPKQERAMDGVVAALEDAGGSVVLVLDDVQDLEGTAVLEDLARLMVMQPPELRLIIITRGELDLPVARIRARGDAVEVGVDELAFTPGEGCAFLGPEIDVGLVDAELASEIVSRVDGWPAGLQLARLVIRDRKTPEELLTAVSGDSPEVARYLAGEVLESQTPEIREFVLATSILSDLTPGVCDAVTARAGSLRTLRSLVDGQVFTSLVDPETPTFRYHRMMREFLRSRLEERADDDVRVLHRRAMEWFERERDLGGTIWHAVRAGESERAMDALARDYVTISNTGRVDQMWSWVGLIGPELVLSHPDLAPMPAWGSLNQHRFDEIEPWLEAIDLVEDTTDESRASFALHAAVIRCFRDRHLGHLDRALEHGHRAIGLVAADDDARVVAIAYAALGSVAALAVDPGAGELLERSIEEGQRVGEDSSGVIGYSYLAFAAADPEEAAAHADTALSMVSTPELERFHRPSMAQLVASRIALAEGRVGDAELLAASALENAVYGVDPIVAALVEAHRARIFHLLGREAEQRAALREAARWTEPLTGADMVVAEVRGANAATRFAPTDDTHLPIGARELGATTSWRGHESWDCCLTDPPPRVMCARG